MSVRCNSSVATTEVAYTFEHPCVGEIVNLQVEPFLLSGITGMVQFNTAQNKMANYKKTGSTAHMENSDFQGWPSCTKCAGYIYSRNISLGS